ncbi:MAG TPA: hypothetical protein VH054_08245 [Polyangiaceae bacterium]|jgi:hypothetical protein|nr:hypothetical protein [Polyangiaceae bacterium]
MHAVRLTFAFVFVFACGDTQSTPDGGPDAAVVEAGPDVDNGEVSTNYPAPHPPLPQLVNAAKGPVLTTPKIVYVFYPNYTNEPALQQFAKDVAASTYWTTTTSEYGVGALTYSGTIDLTDTPPQTISQTDIESWVSQELTSGAFGTPDPETIYTIVYPMGTTITQPNPVSTLLGTVNSCTAFYGYHDNTTAQIGDAGAPTSFAYAVIPTCSGLSSVTETLSHEWIEASTDPLLTTSGTFTLTGGANAAYYGPDADHTVWALLGGGEAGDLCGPEGILVGITPTDVNRLVQRTWSNAAAAASHDPCVPEITGAFFDSAPVLDETVSFTSTLTGMVTSKGVTIARNASKTIEVDLFSDADTGGPWTVSASDVLSTYYGGYGLKPTMTFDWDRTTGQNGEKLHLTITVTGESPIAGAHAFMIKSQLGPRITVWPGLVVEP